MIRLAVRCRPEQAEVVLAELAVLAPNGLEEEMGEGYVEYAIYGAEGELPELGQLEVAAGESLVEVEAVEIPDDWADRWQDFHEPVLIGGRLWVRPSWAEPRPSAVDVVIDPGRAFGTGAHATTRMCIETLVEIAEDGGAGGALIDLGTGSGVLAIAAAKLGWNPVRACDHEPASLEAASENAGANGVTLSLEEVNLREGLPALAPAVVANLTAPLLRHIAAALADVEPPELMICSGLLNAEVEAVIAAFAQVGMQERARRSEGDWASLSFAPR
jgi:ribosomal protein L11 methyltransferase